jgi:hypothetical protein
MGATQEILVLDLGRGCLAEFGVAWAAALLRAVADRRLSWRDLLQQPPLRSK